MELRALENVGLKINESKIYLALLDLGSCLVSEIYKKTNIHRRNIYDGLERLQEKGLVTVIIKNGKKYFEAVNPEKLLDYLKEKEEGIKQILPELKGKYGSIKSEEEGQMFKGVEGMKSIMQDMLNVGETIYSIGSKGKWRSKELEFFYPQFERERIKRRIKIKQIFDYEMKNKNPSGFKCSEYKFFPKEYSSPTHIWIYGDRVVSALWGDTSFAFMIKSKKLVEGYRKFFDFMWKKLAR
jgi:HTH-type transcriptional regulator, sugar sensing transcriptional regulator